MVAEATGRAHRLPKVRGGDQLEEDARAELPAGETVANGRWTNRRWLIVLLVVGWLAHLAWRIWLAQPLYTPIVHGDEDRYLIFARALAGGPGGGGGDTQATRRVGYSLLLAPIYWFTSDPFHVYRVVQVFNAAINALTFPLAYLFAHRVAGMGQQRSVAVAFVAASLPAVTFFAPFALPNAILTPLLLGWLLALHKWMTSTARAAQIWAAGMAGALVGFMYVVHVRALLLLPVHGLIALGLALTRRTRWVAAGASAAAIAPFIVLHPLLKFAIAAEVDTGGIEPENRMIGAFTTVDGLLRTISNATGQLWYLCAATWGLGAIGLVVAIYRLANRRYADFAATVIIAAALVSTLMIAVITAAALPDDGKSNNHAYPGYVIFLAPLWAILGIGGLSGAWKRVAAFGAAAAALMIVMWFVVESYIRPRPVGVFSPIDAPELAFLSDDWTRLRITWATLMTLIAIAVLTLVGAISRRTRFALALTLVAVTAVNVAAMRYSNAMMAEFARLEYTTGPRLVRDAGLHPGDIVVSSVEFAPWVNHQREIFWMKVRRFDPRANPEPPADATVVIANFNTGWGADWNGWEHGWEQVGADPGRGWAVWRRPA